MQVAIHTNHGVITVELDAEKAPLTVENFLTYVRDGFYNGLLFHRVIKGFMIQGGGHDLRMKLRPTREAIRNEAQNGLKNEKYAVSMARTAAQHSATSQFFINVADNLFLDFKNEHQPSGWGYAVFGKVVAGHEIVDQISRLPTKRDGFHDDVPIEPVTIERLVEL